MTCATESREFRNSRASFCGAKNGKGITSRQGTVVPGIVPFPNNSHQAVVAQTVRPSDAAVAEAFAFVFDPPQEPGNGVGTHVLDGIAPGRTKVRGRDMHLDRAQPLAELFALVFRL